MKYEFDKYKWATLLLRARGLFGVGEVSSVSKMAEAGVGLPVAVKMGQLIVLDGNMPLDQLEVFCIEVDQDQQFEGRNRKDMMQRHHHICQFLEAIDRTGDIDDQDIALVVRKGKSGDLRAPPPAIRPPAQQELALPVGRLPDTDMHIERLNGLVAELDRQVGELRGKLLSTNQKIDQLRMQVAVLGDKLQPLDKLVELGGRVDNLDQAVKDVVAFMNDHTMPVAATAAPALAIPKLVEAQPTLVDVQPIDTSNVTGEPDPAMAKLIDKRLKENKGGTR